MIIFLTGFIIAVLFPLFVSSWRAAFLGIGLQGMCLAVLRWDQHPEFQLTLFLQLIDLVIIRSLVTPLVFLRLLKKFQKNLEFELIPANLITWISALSLLSLSFSFGYHLYSNNLGLTLHTCAMAIAILIGLFILSVQVDILGQMIGLLYIESGISLFEIGGHHEPWFIQLSISLIFLWMLFLFSQFLNKFHRIEVNPEDETNINKFESEVL